MNICHVEILIDISIYLFMRLFTHFIHIYIYIYTYTQYRIDFVSSLPPKCSKKSAALRSGIAS